MHIKGYIFNDFFNFVSHAREPVYSIRKKKDTKTPRLKTQIECQQPNRETYEEIHAHTPPASSRKTNTDIYRVCRQTNRQTGRGTDRQTDLTDKQTHRQTVASNVPRPTKWITTQTYWIQNSLSGWISHFCQKKVPKAGYFVGMCCLALLLHLTVNCKIKW